jgi:hypothetical protein
MGAGTCATYGGIHAMQGNPTGAMALADYLGWNWKSKAGRPIVNVPGCPEAMRSVPYGRDARVIGTVVEAHPRMAILKTEISGSRVLDLPFVEQLPRIC